MKDEFVIKMNQAGELLQENMHVHTRNKYKADSPFMWGAIPYILMIGCTVIDIAFFHSLFKLISPDKKELIGFQVAGLAFAADVVAAYAGVHAKRIVQRLSNDRLNLYLLISVPVLALIVNGILRIATMSVVAPEGKIDANVIALTIISIFTPIFTSIGNFAISFQCFDPLAIRLYREEMALDEIRDYIRRLTAIKNESDNFSCDRLKEIDQALLQKEKEILLNDGLTRYSNMKTTLMVALGDPAATSFLSMQPDELFERLHEEMKQLETTSGLTTMQKKIVNFEEVA